MCWHTGPDIPVSRRPTRGSNLVGIAARREAIAANSCRDDRWFFSRFGITGFA